MFSLFFPQLFLHVLDSSEYVDHEYGGHAEGNQQEELILENAYAIWISRIEQDFPYDKILHFNVTFVKGTVGSITTAYYSLKGKSMEDINLPH